MIGDKVNDKWSLAGERGSNAISSAVGYLPESQ